MYLFHEDQECIGNIKKGSSIFPPLTLSNWTMFSLFIVVKKKFLTSLKFSREGRGVSQKLGVALLVSRTDINWRKYLNGNCLVREIA